MKKISPSQKKIITVASIVMLVFLIAVFFIYVPEVKKLGQLKGELLNIQNQIQKIQKLAEGGIELLREKSRQIDSKFPDSEKEGLSLISDFARKSNIEIISTNAKPKTPFAEEDKEKEEIEGKSCQVVSIAMEMKGDYKDLVRYIETLKESLPAYVTVERLSTHSDTQGSSLLTISLELKLYLLS